MTPNPEYSGKKKIPLHPSYPERVCWGCDRYCPVDKLYCGNDFERAPHPKELFGDDWMDFDKPFV